MAYSGTTSGSPSLIYEVGTFTPTLVGQTSAGMTTYSSQEGNYTRIGNRVFIDLLVAITAATGSGNILIGALPFTVAAGRNPVCAVMVDGFTWPASGTSMNGIFNAGATTAGVIATQSGGANQRVQIASVAGSVRMSGVYFV